MYVDTNTYSMYADSITRCNNTYTYGHSRVAATHTCTVTHGWQQHMHTVTHGWQQHIHTVTHGWQQHNTRSLSGGNNTYTHGRSRVATTHAARSLSGGSNTTSSHKSMPDAASIMCLVTSRCLSHIIVHTCAMFTSYHDHAQIIYIPHTCSYHITIMIISYSTCMPCFISRS